MQTFLPYPEFAHSARVLDWRRLGKQRVEAMQLINAIEGRSRGWVNHPAARMWRDHVEALKQYHDAMICEWMRRGFRNTMSFPLTRQLTATMPLWLGNEAFHASHRSNLLRKDADHYSQFGWPEGPDLPYVWPI